MEPHVYENPDRMMRIVRIFEGILLTCEGRTQFSLGTRDWSEFSHSLTIV